MASSVTERTVCYMDLLGFSSAIMRAGGDVDKLSDVSNVIVKVKEKVLDSYGGSDLLFQNLSDSIFISTPDNDGANVEDLIKCAQDISLFLLRSGFAVRGGIASGVCLISPDIILGSPVVVAVKLEEGVAEFPRIAVSRSTLEVLRGSNSREYIRRDPDGIYSLDIFSSMYSALLKTHSIWLREKETGSASVALSRGHFESLIEEVNLICAFLQENFNSVTENKDVFRKYYWLASRFDDASKEPRKRIGSELKRLDLEF